MFIQSKDRSGNIRSGQQSGVDERCSRAHRVVEVNEAASKSALVQELKLDAQVVW